MEFRWFQPGPHAVIADFNALASFTTEDSLLQGVAKQPFIAPNWFAIPGRKMSILAGGVLSVTGTPTYTFGGRLKTTVGVSQLDGTSVGASPAITIESGVTDVHWRYALLLTCRTPGQAAGGLTLNVQGAVEILYPAAKVDARPLVPSAAAPQTWTIATALQVDVFTYFNLTVACSASSASNTIRCKELSWWFW